MSSTANEPYSAVLPSGTTARSGHAQAFDTVPVLPPDALHASVLSRVRAGGRLVGLWGWPADDGVVYLLAAVAADGTGRLSLCRASVPPGTTFPSLAPHV